MNTLLALTFAIFLFLAVRDIWIGIADGGITLRALALRVVIATLSLGFLMMAVRSIYE